MHLTTRFGYIKWSINFIGRDRERQILREALDSAEPELVAITGRRRVGKTFLETEETRDCLTFSMIGVKGASLREQLVNFSNRCSGIGRACSIHGRLPGQPSDRSSRGKGLAVSLPKTHDASPGEGCQRRTSGSVFR